jgi:hypothetical protein
MKLVLCCIWPLLLIARAHTVYAVHGCGSTRNVRSNCTERVLVPLRFYSRVLYAACETVSVGAVRFSYIIVLLMSCPFLASMLVYHPRTFSAPVSTEPSIDPEPEGNPDPAPPLPPAPLGTHCVPFSETSSAQPLSQDETRHLESTHRTSATPSSAVQSTPWPSD